MVYNRLFLIFILLYSIDSKSQSFLSETDQAVEATLTPSYSDEVRTADDKIWNVDAETFDSTGLGRLFGAFADIFGMDFSNPAFRTAFWNGGSPFGPILGSLDFAREVSRSICKLPGDNGNGDIREHQNETDAIRHFSLSAHLASTIGEPRANLIMSSREKKETIGKYDLMDQHNNLLGFKLGRTLYYYRKNGLKTESEIQAIIKTHAKKKLERGQLSVLSSGGKFYTEGCSKSIYPNKKHRNIKLSSFIIISGTYTPECDKKFIRNICKNKGTSRGVLFCIKKILKNKFENIATKSKSMKYQSIVTRRRNEVNQCIDSMKRIEELAKQEDRRLKESKINDSQNTSID